MPSRPARPEGDAGSRNQADREKERRVFFFFFRFSSFSSFRSCGNIARDARLAATSFIVLLYVSFRASFRPSSGLYSISVGIAFQLDDATRDLFNGYGVSTTSLSFDDFYILSIIYNIYLSPIIFTYPLYMHEYRADTSLSAARRCKYLIIYFRDRFSRDRIQIFFRGNER